jgi:hypothetical protein
MVVFLTTKTYSIGLSIFKLFYSYNLARILQPGVL